MNQHRWISQWYYWAKAARNLYAEWDTEGYIHTESVHVKFQNSGYVLEIRGVTGEGSRIVTGCSNSWSRKWSNGWLHVIKPIN